MSWVGDVFGRLGVTGQDREPSFPDGAAFRVEIPSVEGPAVLDAVLRAAEAEGITVNRVSQGSGAMLLRMSELRDMAQAGRDAGLEVCLFVGPRERFGVGAHARSADGRAHGDQVRGLRQLAYALEDVLRATEAGIRSFLVADLGLLRAVTRAQASGALPAGLVWKVSASMSPTNPVTLKVLKELGASTVNIPADVTLDELADMRAAGGLPLDLYVESPDPLARTSRTAAPRPAPGRRVPARAPRRRAGRGTPRTGRAAG